MAIAIAWSSVTSPDPGVPPPAPPPVGAPACASMFTREVVVSSEKSNLYAACPPSTPVSTCTICIPKGVRGGQHLRLSGQGGAGTTDITANGASTGAPAVAGDLYLEIHFAAHSLFRIDDRDVYIDVPLAPWEAALGASVTVPTPAGEVQVSVPVGSAIGRRLRLKGKGIPANPPGDFYVVLGLALPAADTADRKAAYAQLAAASADFDPRAALVTPRKEPR